MQFDFENKNVLITGGSRGIGKACCQLFAENGANVFFTFKTNKDAAEDTLNALSGSGNHQSYQLDITDPINTKEVFEKIISEHGKIDILINNAGVFVNHTLTEVSYEEWQESWQETLMTNLIGVSNLCYLAGHEMIKNGGGKIVNVSSRGAFRGEPNHPAYGASKAGLNSFSQSLAQFLAPYNITVGVIAPGFVETDMAADVLNSEIGEQVKRQSPLNRVARPEEVANAIAFFAVEGVEYMTGGIIDVNGASYLRS